MADPSPTPRFVHEIEPQPAQARRRLTPGPKNETQTCGYCKRKLPDHSPRCERRTRVIATLPQADETIAPDYRSAVVALRSQRNEIDAAIATLERLGRVR